jgi:molecular chaperone DnaJ
MAKSYFAILGVTVDASPDDIRSAYRRLAKEYHPDHSKGDSGLFRQIQEAYHILGDASRRRKYEKALTAAPKKPAGKWPIGAPEPLVPEQGPIDLGEISPIRSFQTFRPSYDQVFDWLWDNFSSMNWPKSGRVENLTLEVLLTTEQALRGGNASVLVPAQAGCPVCRGRGHIGYYECLRCAGEGSISGEIPVSISFPPGLTKDHAVMIPLERFGIRNLHLTVLFRPIS